MSDPEWARAKEIFGRALELPREQRASFIEAECAGEPELRARVEGLLAADEGAGDFLSAPSVIDLDGAEPAAHAGSAAAGVGDRIGPYTLVEMIGEGGFGAVFAAEQSEPLRRRVAVKVIKLGMDTRQVIAQFEHERQALALMDHPNIARVFDAGATSEGRPYFVMEFITGVPITQYCDQARLTPRQRLELFIPVCQAVQHAHQKGIIHRDLKPSNVLVTLQDGIPTPKIIDFGIAKATAQRLSEKTAFTEKGQFIGTPEYMSPEQAMAGLDIDTRSDVYSLGVLLYELLTGATPFDAKELRSAAWAEMQRIIREVEPPKPSTRLSTLESLPSVAANRQTEPGRLGAQVRGDLDWIAMKCLEKDRARRYETANGLAADIQRHLSGEAVAAAPPSASYRAWKFMRRHRGPVAAGVLVMLTMMAGMASTGWQASLARTAETSERRLARAETAARKEADAKRASAERTLKFMAGMLEGVGPSVALGRDTTMLTEILDSAAARLEAGELRDEPEAELNLRLTIGKVHLEMEQLPAAEAILRPTVDLAGSLAQPAGDTPQRAESLHLWGVYLRSKGSVGESAPFLQQSVDMARRLGPDQAGLLAEALSGLGETRAILGPMEEAEQIFEESLELFQRLHPGDSDEVAAALSNVAYIRKYLGRSREGAPLTEQSVEMLRRLHPGDHPKLATGLSNLANLFLNSDPAKAEGLFREALEMRRRLYKRDHSLIAATLGNIGYALGMQERYADAAAQNREAIEMYRRLFPNGNLDLAKELNSLAVMYVHLNMLDEAEPLLREALEMKRGLFQGADHPSIAVALNSLGGLLQRRGHPAEAKDLFEQGLNMRRRIYKNADHADIAISLKTVAGAWIVLKRPENAAPPLEEAIAVLRRLNAQDDLLVAYLLTDLADCKADMGEPEKAYPLYHEALAVRRACLPANSPGLAAGLSQLGTSLLARGGADRAAEAEVVLRECLTIREGAFPAGHKERWLVYEAQGLVGRALALQSKWTDAEPLLLESNAHLVGDPGAPSPSRVGDIHPKRQSVLRLVLLYQAWDKADPGHGHDTQAAEWKAKLDALDAAATSPK